MPRHSGKQFSIIAPKEGRAPDAYLDKNVRCGQLSVAGGKHGTVGLVVAPWHHFPNRPGDSREQPACMQPPRKYAPDAGRLNVLFASLPRPLWTLAPASRSLGEGAPYVDAWILDNRLSRIPGKPVSNKPFTTLVGRRGDIRWGGGSSDCGEGTPSSFA